MYLIKGYLQSTKDETSELFYSFISYLDDSIQDLALNVLLFFAKLSIIIRKRTISKNKD